MPHLLLCELTSLGLTGPQHDKVLSVMSRLLEVISQLEAQLDQEKTRGKWREKKEKAARVSPKEKSNPPSHSEGKPSEPPRTAQGVNDLVWLECPSTLEKLGLSTRAARSNLGRWLKQTKSPERVLEAVRAAERAGTKDPVPYIVEALKPKVVAFSGDWDVGAKRQIEQRNKDLQTQISAEEREAKFREMQRLRDRLRGVAGSEEST
jgi:hypothetical protein